MQIERTPHSQYANEVMTVLDYGGKPVRMYCFDNMFWWALIDLGNSSRAAARLEDYEKMTLTLSKGHSRQRGGAQKLILINEPGLYHLLLTSMKPEAKLFRRWITAEVIPSIRKNGGYIIGQGTMDAGELVDAAKQVAQNVLSTRNTQLRELLIENADQAALLQEYEPKVRYYDAVLRTRGAIPIRLIAKDYGVSAQWLNKYLHERGVQYKCSGTWLLYQPYANLGYTQTRTILDGTPYSKLFTCWTPKGRAFLYEFLKSDGILPLSERMDVSGDIEGFMLL